MKKLLILLFLFLPLVMLRAQTAVPIVNLPTQLAKPANAWLPVYLGGTTKKIDINTITADKMDTVFSRNDSLFGRKGGQLFFIKKDTPSILPSKITILLTTASFVTISGHSYIRLPTAQLAGSTPFNVNIEGYTYTRINTLENLFDEDSHNCGGWLYYYDSGSGYIYIGPCYMLQSLQDKGSQVYVNIDYYAGH